MSKSKKILTHSIHKLKKIALVGDCLAGGGAEKVHATLSNFFHENNFEVHSITFLDWIEYDFSGEIFNLGKLKSKTIFDKLKRLFILKKYLKKNQFDYIIDFRYRVNAINELLISHCVYNTKVFYTVHSGVTKKYIPENHFLANLIYSKHQVVTVSKAIEKLLENHLKSKITTIYNPFEINKIQSLGKSFVPVERNYIVAVGRMNRRVKQFDKLILAYHKSDLHLKDVSLLILGEGKYMDELKTLVEKLNLTSNVIFKGNQSNPFPYQKNALFLVVSSKNEGFANTLVESLINETPVISFDCFCGPNEIIDPNLNGILVENQNIDKLSEAMRNLYCDKELYTTFKENSLTSITQFSVENIGKQWIFLFNQTKK